MRRATLFLGLVLALPAHAEVTYLDVRFNGRKALTAQSVEFDQPSPTVLSATPAVWKELGVVLSEEEAGKAILTTAELGLQPTIDNPTMTVDFWAPPGRLPYQQLGWQEAPPKVPVSPSAKGVLVNYDVALAYNPKSGVAASVGHEVRASVAGGVLSTTGQLNASKQGAEYVRGYTTWTKDMPDKRLSLQVGDIQTSPNGTTGSVAMAGVRIASDPALDPTQPSFPVPVLGGVAVAPSQAQAYLNGNPLQSYDVEAGGFQFNNIGFASGANAGSVILTDQFGRQTVVDSRFYFSTDLLRKGLSKWEINAGLLRDGMTNNYTTPALSASYARGMTDKWTMEANIEVTKNAHNASLGSKVVLGRYGQLGVSVGKSSSDKGSGTALAVDYAYNSRDWTVGFSHIRQSDNWWQLSHERGNAYPLNATSLWGSYRFNDQWSMAGSIARVQQGPDERNRAELRLNWQQDRSYLSLGVAREGKDNQVQLTYTRPLGDMTGSIDYSRRGRGARTELRLAGDRDTSLGAMNWNGRLGHSNGQYYGSAAARWDNPKFDANARVDVYGKDVTLSAGYRSSLWWGEGTAQQSKSVGATLAVVKVANVEGVPVYLENKLVGKTNKNGTLVVGPVNQLVPNSIRIDERALPLGMEVATTTIQAVPNRNSVALVDFGLKSMAARAFNVKLKDGTTPNMGAALNSDSEETMVGYDGGIYLEQPKAGQVLTVTHDKGVCKATIPDPLPAFEEVPDLVCE